MSLDIYNSTSRPVICVSNNDQGWWSCKDNAPMLTVGETYTLVDIDVYDWHSRVFLKEFPGHEFNSILFNEVG
jgi:hypothetical protein